MTDESQPPGGTAPAGPVSRRRFLVLAGVAGAALAGAGRAMDATADGLVGKVAGGGPGRGFVISAATSSNSGFAVAGVQAHNPMGDHLDKQGHLSRDLFAVHDFAATAHGVYGGVAEQMWQGAHGSVRVHVEMQHLEQGLDFRLHVENGYRFNIRTISFDLPAFTAPAPAHTLVMDSCCGGRVYPWRPGRGHDGSNYYRYSALVVFYDARSTAGLAVDFFDDQLRQSGCGWRIDKDTCRPRVHSYLNLSKGCHTTLNFRLRPYARGMPEVALDEYRQQRLSPCLQRLGMVESSGYKATGPWAETGWPYPDLVKQVAQAKALGAKGYIQWAPPDGQGFYEPFTERLGWFGQIKTASRLGLPMGVLIDPRFTPRLGQNARAWALDKKFVPARVLEMASEAGAAQEYLLKMRNNLAANGVSVAFWDTGGLPYPSFTAEGYLTLLEQWKRAGIRIMPEVSRDFSAWITGVALNWGLPHGAGWGGRTFTFAQPPQCSLLKRVTPGVKMFRGGVLNALPGQGHRYWWDAFAGDGQTIPILSTGVYAAKPPELETWAKEHDKIHA